MGGEVAGRSRRQLDKQIGGRCMDGLDDGWREDKGRVG